MDRSSNPSYRRLAGLVLGLIALAQGLMPLHAVAGQRAGLTVEICGALGSYEVVLPLAVDDDAALHDADPCIGLCAMADLEAAAEPVGPPPPGSPWVGTSPIAVHRRNGRRRSNRPRDPPLA